MAQAVEYLPYRLGNCRSGGYNSNGLLTLIRLETGKVTVEQTHAFAIEDARPVVGGIER